MRMEAIDVRKYPSGESVCGAIYDGAPTDTPFFDALPDMMSREEFLSTIRRALETMPQVIEHTEYMGQPFYCKRVLYLRAEYPSVYTQPVIKGGLGGGGTMESRAS